MSLVKNKTYWTAEDISKETNSGEVITKPNQSQTIQEILFRNTNGMHYDNYHTPFYEDQASFSSQPLNVIQNMELTEKMQFLNDHALKVEALKQKISSFKAEKDAEALAIASQQLAESEALTPTLEKPLDSL